MTIYRDYKKVSKRSDYTAVDNFYGDFYDGLVLATTRGLEVFFNI